MYSVKELTDILCNNDIVIYGAGFQAKRLYKCLKKMGISNRIKSFAISSLDADSPSFVNDKPLCAITDVSEGPIILISAHNKSAEQMESTLHTINLSNYIVMHPYLNLLEYGEPIIRNTMIEVDSILKNMRQLYYVDIIYLAIEKYFNKNNIGDKLYLTMQSKYSNMDTAHNRLNELYNKIKSYTLESAECDYSIRLSSDNIILDGNHRVALAKYFEVERIKADIFDVTFEEYVETLENAVFTLDELKKIFTPYEVQLIFDIDRKLRG